MSKAERHQVYFKNLDSAITSKELCNIAGQFGEILNHKLAKDENGTSKGYGVIEFDTEEAVENFTKKVNCTLFNEKKVYICKYTNRIHRKKLLEKDAKFIFGPHDGADASLDVGNIDVDVSEEDIFKEFSTFGTVVSVYICKDMHSGMNTGCAYVHFQQRADAHLALDTLHLSMFCRRIITVNWFQTVKCQIGNIIVKNLHENIDGRVLSNIFSCFGTILRYKIFRDKYGNSNYFAMIQFSKEIEAIHAIKERHNTELYGKRIFVGTYIPHMQREQMLKINEPFNVVYVKNFEKNVSEEKFHAMFTKYGDIKMYTIARTDDGKSKGFGFVLFESPEAASNAICDLNRKVIEGRTIYVRRAQLKREREEEIVYQFKELKRLRSKHCKESILYVKKLDNNLEDLGLRKLFSIYGKIVSAKVKPGEGYGFVHFLYSEAASKAIFALGGSQN